MKWIKPVWMAKSRFDRRCRHNFGLKTVLDATRLIDEASINSD